MKRQTDPYGKAMKNRLSVWEKNSEDREGKGGRGAFSLFPLPSFPLDQRPVHRLWRSKQNNKTKNIYSTNCPIFRFENKPSSGAKRKRKIKLKVQTELFKYKRGMPLEDARARGKWEGAKRGDSLFLFPLLSHRPLRRYSLTVSCDRSMTASNDKRRLGTSQVCERGTLSFKTGIVKGKGLDLRTEPTRTKLCWVPPGYAGYILNKNS